MSKNQSNPLVINPGFRRDNQTLYFDSRELNAFTRPTYVDNFGFYQNAFGVYSYMGLDARRDFIVHKPKGIPLMWQARNSCSVDPTKNVVVRSEKIRPERGYLHTTFCQDQMFDSCFEHLIKYSNGAYPELDAQGNAIISSILDELNANMNLASRFILTLGQLFDPSTANFDPNQPVGIADLFQRTTTAVRGWVPLFAALADEGEAHLNIQNLIPNDFIQDCKNWSGSILDIYDQLECQAPKPLQNLINNGGQVRSNTTGGDIFRPLFLVSGELHNALVREYRTQSAQIAQNNPRISKERVTSANGSVGVMYYIDDVPVVRLDDINGYDQFLTSQTHFAGIVASGNIQLGMAYDAMPNDIENTNAGLMIQMNTNASTGSYGDYNVLAWNLFQVALADSNFAVATQRIVNP
jgi:hypothetical protein